jgi:CcmD family protein
MSHKTVMILIMTVPMITWIGIFGYLVMIDRSLRKMERDEKVQDDL